MDNYMVRYTKLHPKANDELVQAVIKKTGLPEASARQAVDTVLKFLKEKLPQDLGLHLDNAFTLGSSGVAGMAKTIVGMFTGHGPAQTPTAEGDKPK